MSSRNIHNLGCSKYAASHTVWYLIIPKASLVTGNQPFLIETGHYY